MSAWAEPPRPKSLFGMLSKMSPGWLINTWQKRFFVLQDGVLYWSTNAVTATVGPEGLPGQRGAIDMGANPGCHVTLEGGEKSNQFALRPPEGGWKTAGFNGAAEGRVLFLDTGGREPRENWAEALRVHIDYAAKVREMSAGRSAKGPPSAAKGAPPPAAKGTPGSSRSGAKEPELDATEAAKEAHRAHVAQRLAAERRVRVEPVLRDATEDEIVKSLLGPRPSEVLREELEAEDILCN